jgi:hypothetical protein
MKRKTAAAARGRTGNSMSGYHSLRMTLDTSKSKLKGAKLKAMARKMLDMLLAGKATKPVKPKATAGKAAASERTLRALSDPTPVPPPTPCSTDPRCSWLKTLDDGTEVYLCDGVLVYYTPN